MRPRYAEAPSWTASPISCIFSVPSEALSTSARNTAAMISATTPMPATTDTMIVLSFERSRSLAAATNVAFAMKFLQM